MKAILLSIKPEWVAKILNGEKTIEIRKKFPKDYVGWVYLYCSNKHNGWCMVGINGHKSYYEKYSKESMFNYDTHRIGNGKVVARFWCDKVERIWKTTTSVWLCESELSDKLYKESCLSDLELDRYLKPKALGFNYRYGFAIHFSKLEIFDRPRELSEFQLWCNNICTNCKHLKMFDQTLHCRKPMLTKAPQNYCYVEGEE